MPRHNGTEWKSEKAWWINVGGTWHKSTTIWKKVSGVWEKMSLITASIVSTLAGSGSDGNTDGTGEEATFSSPYGVAATATHVFVSSLNGNKIRQVEISTGIVSTLAGSGTALSVDGTGTAASFNSPRGVAANSTHVFVCSIGSNNIRQIEISTGIVTTLAGSGSAGDSDGTGTAASFDSPRGLAANATHVFVCDRNNNKIRQIEISTGVVTTLAGSGAIGSTNGSGSTASFSFPNGVATNSTHVFVADSGNDKVRAIDISTGVVTTLASSFGYPSGIDANSTHVFVCDRDANKVFSVEIDTGVVTTLAGSGSSGSTDGYSSEATFSAPYGVSSNTTHVFVADTSSNKVRAITL